MTTGRETASRKKALAAALRRFPQQELAIHRLFDRIERFRDICEELAEADQALSRVGDAPAAIRDERRAEWRAVVDRLVSEVEAELVGQGLRRPAGAAAAPLKR